MRAIEAAQQLREFFRLVLEMTRAGVRKVVFEIVLQRRASAWRMQQLAAQLRGNDDRNMLVFRDGSDLVFREFAHVDAIGQAQHMSLLECVLLRRTHCTKQTTCWNK